MYFLSAGWGMSRAAPGWPLHMHPENSAGLAPVAVCCSQSMPGRLKSPTCMLGPLLSPSICIRASTSSMPEFGDLIPQTDNITHTIHCSEFTTWRKLRLLAIGNMIFLTLEHTSNTLPMSLHVSSIYVEFRSNLVTGYCNNAFAISGLHQLSVTNIKSKFFLIVIQPSSSILPNYFEH